MNGYVILGVMIGGLAGLMVAAVLAAISKDPMTGTVMLGTIPAGCVIGARAGAAYGRRRR